MHALERILRFRRLTEQQAHRELERATQVLRAATAACERQSKIVIEQRASLAHRLAENLPVQMKNTGNPFGSGNNTQEWLLEEAALEFSGWNRTQLEQICAAEEKRVEPLIEQYIERRRSLRQTEQLVEQQAELARVEQEKRMQAEADEWFLQRSLCLSRTQQSS